MLKPDRLDRPLDQPLPAAETTSEQQLANMAYALEAAQWTSADWKAHQQDLRRETFLAPDDHLYYDIESAFDEMRRQHNAQLIHERQPAAPYQPIDLAAVVRAPSLQGWENSYHSTHDPQTYQRGENAVIEIARKMAGLIKAGLAGDQTTPGQAVARISEALQQEFFDRDSRTTYARRLDGPRGPLYLIQDGSHRTAAAKLLHFKKIFARVGHLADPGQAQKVWYESLAIMSASAREELLRVYAAVYPPTASQLATEAAEQAQTATYLQEIQNEIELYQVTQAQRASEHRAAAQKLQLAFEEADTMAKRVAHKARFQRLRAEAGLAYLKKHAPADLWEEYEQRIDESGYLMRRDGKDSWLRSTSYDIKDSYKMIMIVAADNYALEFPDEVAALDMNKT